MTTKVEGYAGVRFRFTTNDLIEATDIKASTIRSAIYRLCNKGVIRHVGSLRPNNIKIYQSDIDPKDLIGYEDPPPSADYIPPSTFANRPFGDEQLVDNLRGMWMSRIYGEA